jgi:Carboxypeptidase regulatory-like domain
MCSLRLSAPFILTALLTTTLSLHAHAQLPQTHPGSSFTSTRTTAPTPFPALPTPIDIFGNKLLDAPASHIATETPADRQSGSILGTVLDAGGAEVSDALVTLENTSSGTLRTLTTDASGFFKFDAVEPGKFNLTITSNGFAPWFSPDVGIQTGQSCDLPSIVLQIASATTDVEVSYTRHDLAEDQMHSAEKQRVLGIFPNFYVSYVSNAAPLSSSQKFRLALRTTVDPVSIAIPGVIAAIEQSQSGYNGFGTGPQGFAKRFGAASADSAIGMMLTDAILPSVLHQDPRYFYKGTGSIRSRAFYAVATAFICKGDNGRWQPNYSNVLGSLASAGISNIYYPSTNRNGVQLTIDNWLIGTASGAVGTLFQEFLVKKISRGVHPPMGI